MNGLELIAKERKEQIEKHGRTIALDFAQNNKGQLAYAAVSILEEPLNWRELRRPANWDQAIWLKMCKKSYEDRLIYSGAFIASEIDRINH